MKHLRKFNESIIQGIEILPEEAIKELEMYVDYKNSGNKIEVFKDPIVVESYALRIYRKNDNYTFDLLWNRGAYDEVEFKEFPPKSGDLRFF